MSVRSRSDRCVHVDKSPRRQRTSKRWGASRGPERAKQIDRSSFLAFVDGRRECIGEEFAWTELLVVLATVLQRRRLTLVSAPPHPQAAVTVETDRPEMTPLPRGLGR
ncbi:cytochrome P450 [Streptomyces sp. Tue6028]|uniref:cytochrome P450 n=1 Tax=Streptomyces sp. Tue6028 TaxID=2036037 RepID=UPI00211B7F9D|nr:cytochrome P450 [Streptomyces sp. Tue6028]